MSRIDRFLEVFTRKGADAALIHRPENIRYLTGYAGEGCAFLCADGAYIITDFRYVEAAGREASDCVCVRTTADYREKQAVKELSEKHGVKTLMCETDFLTHDEFSALEATLSGVTLCPTDGLVQELREIKDAGEISCICKAAEISCKAFERLLETIHPGMTEKEAQIQLDYEMLRLGSEGNAFSTIAAAGVNGSLPHAVPSDYVIRKGDLLTLDFGAKFGGYCADMTRTVGFGPVNDALRAIYETVYEAHMKALGAVKVGAVCGDLDAIARDVIDARYEGAFGHSLGHGVGLYIHEMPRVARGSGTVLRPGHVITIEPGVYIPGVGGCRIEDTVILTEDGVIDPVTSPKQLIEL